MKKKKEIFLRREVLKLSAAFFALLLLISGCKKEVTDIGSELQDDNLNVTVSDTFSIITYSEEIDSMESDETSISMLGAYNDPVFGGVNCGIVTQIVPEAVTQEFPTLADIKMDSVVLALRFASINFYANFNDLDVQVFEITDVLERTDKVYHTFENPTFDEGQNLVLDDMNIISPEIVKNQIVGDDTLAPQFRIHLDTLFGKDLVADSHAGLMGENFSTTTFKGLYIRVNVDEAAPSFGIPSGQGTVLYFALENLLSKMTLYYHTVEGGSNVYDIFDFNINSTCARYNKIDYERTGTAVETALNDVVGDEVFYMQSGAIRSIIEFPFITDFNKDAEGNNASKIINEAVLILPVQDFQMDSFDPAPFLFFFRKRDDKLSSITRDYRFSEGTTYNEEKKEFRFKLTKEIQGLINGDIENVGYRIFSSGFFASTIERIVFNGSNTTLKNKPRLEITYTEY